MEAQGATETRERKSRPSTCQRHMAAVYPLSNFSFRHLCGFLYLWSRIRAHLRAFWVGRGMLTPMWVLCLSRMRNANRPYANNLRAALHRFQTLCIRSSYSTHSDRKTSVTTIPFVCVGGVRGRPSKPGQAWAWRRERQVAIVSA